MKKLNFFFLMTFLLSTLILTTQSCKSDPEPEPDACALAVENNEWGYDDFGGTGCWGAVCSSHGACTPTSTSKQSPINITGAVAATDLPTLSFNSSNTKTTILNNGHTIEFEQEPGSFVTYGTTSNGLFHDLTLGQFHFHGKSEHQVEGSQAALEAHLVHRDIWGDEYMVVSVLFEEGASNPFLAKFVNNLPATQGTTYTDATTYTPYDILPTNKSYYTYEGSLTTPPCSEIVTWIVMENKVTATAEEIAAFTSIMGNNFREVQALNGRTIKHHVE